MTCLLECRCEAISLRARDDVSGTAELAGNLKLVVINVLAFGAQSRNSNRHRPKPNRCHQGSNASVANDNVRLLDQRGKLLIVDEFLPPHPENLRPRRSSSVLDDHLLVLDCRQHPVECAVKGLRVRAERAEDQKSAPRYWAFRKWGITAGHWTKKSWATGWTNLPVKEGLSTRAKLSM